MVVPEWFDTAYRLYTAFTVNQCTNINKNAVSVCKRFDLTHKDTKRLLLNCYDSINNTNVAKSLILLMKLEVVLTAVFRSELPQVEVLHGEVDKGGQLAGSPSFREAFQVFARQEGQGRTTTHINTY